MKKAGFMKDAFTLFMITLISGICLGAVYEITKEPIAIAMENTKQAAYRQVFPDAASFAENAGNTAAIETTAADIAGLGYGNIAVKEIVDAVDASGAVIGHVVSVSSNDGFGGEVKISAGITNEGVLNGIAFLTLNETPGLGMNAQSPEFYTQYEGKQVESLSVTKSGSPSDTEINAISGATITSKAITNCVNGALYFVKNCIGGGSASVAPDAKSSEAPVNTAVRTAYTDTVNEVVYIAAKRITE